MPNCANHHFHMLSSIHALQLCLTSECVLIRTVRIIKIITVSIIKIMGHFQKYHNTLCFPSKILHKDCFHFLLGLTMVPRENKNNAYAKIWRTNKEYYGVFESTCLPPMWRGFNFRTWHHMWIEFVGSLLCSERFFPGYSSFPLSSKTNI